MVKSILKQRWWWNSGSKSDEELNLYWTEFCKPHIFKLLPCKNEGKKENPKIYNHLDRKSVV